ncbi:MAG: adenylosuccinate lyase [Candidatus Dasytiphilus stammeri]
MELSFLTAISPIDGRYANLVSSLRKIFTEYNFIRLRVQIEIRWLQKLANCSDIKEITKFDSEDNDYLENIITSFSEDDAKKIKNIETTTHHDVKAIEYFIKQKIITSSSKNLKSIIEFVHFACTSEDINNLSYAIMIKSAITDVILPQWNKIIAIISIWAHKYRATPMLSHTHGQPAATTTVGKEMANIASRMIRQFQKLKKIEILGKINGAVGNYNAHCAAYPTIDWQQISEEFVTSFGVTWNPYTTQIEPHDYIAEIFDCVRRFNTILINFNRDIWGYLALNYFKQKPFPGEIGSSTMPHKINPIFFENAEANLGLSNAILMHLANKLPISRWQRDLTDSTLLRNLGVGLSYALIAWKNTFQGIKKLELNYSQLLIQLDQNWEILAESIQTVMRKYGISNPYEKLKELTQGKRINSSAIRSFIDLLPLPEVEKGRLKNLTPFNYLGLAIELVDHFTNLTAAPLQLLNDEYYD